LELADELWAALLRTVQPLGAIGRAQLADCFEACARLKEALGKKEEAERFQRRSQSARKDPAALNRRESGGQGRSAGWDSHAWVLRQAGEAGAPATEAIRKAYLQLELDELKARRWRITLALGGGGLAGLWFAVVTGLPLGLLTLMGGFTGWLWVRRP
jgi:hypothetical protein